MSVCKLFMKVIYLSQMRLLFPILTIFKFTLSKADKYKSSNVSQMNENISSM